MAEKVSNSHHYSEWKHIAYLQQNQIDVLEKRIHALDMELGSYRAECEQLRNTLNRLADRTKDTDSFAHKVHSTFFPFTHYEDI